jgi:diaminobutyrate-2-oxoglutarate transaminase
MTPTDPRCEFDQTESGVRYYCRHMPAVFERARNAEVWDEHGNRYIDFLSACGSLNYGHNNPCIKAQVVDYLSCDGITTSLDLHTTAKREFLQTFRTVVLAPRGLDYRVQFTGPTGTNAVEAALKLARKVTRRSAVVAFTNAFHGMTAAAQSVSGRRGDHSGMMGHVIRLPYEGYLGAHTEELDRFAAMVNDPSGGMDAPAAFIVETVQGEGGLNAASTEWIRHLAATARKLGALLIVDDVQAGCGRTGEFFSFESAGIQPDMVCLAKSIGGLGLPMALVLIKHELDQWNPGEHNGTFRGNNLAFVAGAAAIRLWEDRSFLVNMATAAQAVKQWVHAAADEFPAVVAGSRGRGLFSGIAFHDPAVARGVSERAFREGVLIETSGPYGEVLKLMPPLTIEPEVLDEGLTRLRRALQAAIEPAVLKTAA